MEALNRLKKLEDIFVTKPDFGSGIVVMDKSEYIRLLSAASIDDVTKFAPVDDKSSRLAHLYGLPKTHKAKLSMRPILSATATYNFNLAKWLEQKLKPLSVNEYKITGAFEFADEIRSIPMNDEDIYWSPMT